ncbi:aldose epimerase family protein [Roseateles koreensis]|uniref:Aldose 1-epimerase n=1 Tax=Roseateles koreensis TaxID=2987526 RepID=A0ABT5KU70_9BURK|nr:aldose epimerase family protein [Roseateles koreensis]MDC8786464.1 galactose mutarotase [Roseateles koreensis]
MPLPTAAPSIHRREFGLMPDGRVVHEYTLDNGRGLRLSAINYGGIVTGLHVPDPQGRSANVVLGFDKLTDYLERNPHFGTIVGRYANRIAKGQFMLGGQSFSLPINDGENCLHGGAQSFGTRYWDITPQPLESSGNVAIELSYTSADGEGGFPGEMQVKLRYTLGAAAYWQIDYEARCNKPTIVNLTHHDYFNLAGHGSALQHRLTIAAQRYTEVGAGLIPSGIAPVEGTPFDFRASTVIEDRIRQAHPQFAPARGYDHNWLLDSPSDGGLHLAATLADPQSGRIMEIHTTEPALQFYSGNFLDATLLGSGGAYYRQGDGLCLETQHSPDSPNHPGHPDWPSTVLRPGEIFRSSTVHKFPGV